MSRVTARPEAILDGSPGSATIVSVESDASRYVTAACVFPDKFLELLEDVPFLADPDAIRLVGTVGSPEVDGRSMMTIGGEEAVDPLEIVSYGFDVIPAPSGESQQRLLRVSRLVKRGEVSLQTLGIVGITGSGDAQVFRPEFLDNPTQRPIENPAQISEFTQIVAAAVDAAEWAFN